MKNSYNFPYIKITKEISNKVKEKNTIVNLFLDVQNIFISNYFLDDETLSLSLESKCKKEIKKLLFFISDISYTFKDLNIKNNIYIYWDINRNLFNESMVSWKENREKSINTLVNKNPVLWLSQNINKKITYIVLELLELLSDFISNVFTIKFEYIDSDIVPSLVMEYNSNYSKKDYFNVIISSDNDYIHLLSDNVYRFPLLKKQRNYKGDNPLSLLESKDEILYYLRSKYKLTLEDSYYLFINYSLIHSLSGDSSDFKSLIKNRGIKYWLKYLKNKYQGQYDIIGKLNSENYIKEISDDLEISEEDTKNLLKRYLLTDHRFLSKIILSEYKYSDFFNYNNIRIINNNKRIFLDSINMEKKKRILLEDFKKLCLWLEIKDKEYIRKMFTMFNPTKGG